MHYSFKNNNYKHQQHLQAFQNYLESTKSSAIVYDSLDILWLSFSLTENAALSFWWPVDYHEKMVLQNLDVQAKQLFWVLS